MAFAAFPRDTFQDQSGNALASKVVQIIREADGELATLYTDRAGTTQTATLGETTTTADGQITIYVGAGAYRVVDKATTNVLRRYVAVGTGAEKDALDGRAVFEASPVSDAATEFEVGGTFTIDPSNPRHRVVRVSDSLTPLTANMTVDLNVALQPWAPGDLVFITKGDATDFKVAVTGFNLDALGTTTLTRDRDSVMAIYETTDSNNGPGLDGGKFASMLRTRWNPNAKDTKFDPGSSNAVGPTVHDALVALAEFQPEVATLDLADGSDTIAAGSSATIEGTAAGSFAYTVADGTVEGQLTRVTVKGDPDGNTIAIEDSGDPAAELVPNAEQNAWYLFEWSGSATTLIASGTTVELGPYATRALNTIDAAEIQADDTDWPEAFDDVAGFIVELRAELDTLDATPTPSVTTSNASPFVVTTAMIASQNVTVTTHQASVDFDIDKTLPAGTWINFLPAHTGATVSIQDDAGSISGTAALINGAPASAYISSNAGSAPVVQVFGGIEPTITGINSTRSYVESDYRKSFTLVASAGDQTMPAAAAVGGKWWVKIINRSGGAVDIVGADATEALADDGVAVIEKLDDGSLVLIGNGSSTVIELDAA